MTGVGVAVALESKVYCCWTSYCEIDPSLDIGKEWLGTFQNVRCNETRPTEHSGDCSLLESEVVPLNANR